MIRKSFSSRLLSLSPYWRDEWEERAAIMQYDGQMTRSEAEDKAIDDIEARIKSGTWTVPTLDPQDFMDWMNGAYAQ